MENTKENSPAPTDRGQSKWILFLGGMLFGIGVVQLTNGSHNIAIGVILMVCGATTLGRWRKGKKEL